MLLDLVSHLLIGLLLINMVVEAIRLPGQAGRFRGLLTAAPAARPRLDGRLAAG